MEAKDDGVICRSPPEGPVPVAQSMISRGRPFYLRSEDIPVPYAAPVQLCSDQEAADQLREP